MRLTTPLSRLSSLVVLGSLLAGSGCVLHLGNWSDDSSEIFGHSVSGHDGVLTVDGTRLPFNRWVDMSAEYAGTETLELGTASDAIRVSGVPGSTVTLRARLYSEIEGDGTAVLEHGRLVARSQGGGKVFINAIEGTVPEGTALNVRSGTGEIEVSALAGEAALSMSDGTGTMTLHDCTAGPIMLDGGTGDSHVQRIVAGTVNAHSGTGDVVIEDLTATLVGIEIGTGDVSLARCHATRITLDAGTGDTSMTGCEAGVLKCESGTGDLVLDGGKYEDVRFSSGTGDLTQHNSVAIGSLKVD